MFDPDNLKDVDSIASIDNWFIAILLTAIALGLTAFFWSISK